MIITSIILSALALGLSMWIGKKNPVKSSGLTAGMLVLLMLAPVLLWVPKVHLDVHIPWVPSEIGSEVTKSTTVTSHESISLLNVLLVSYGVIGVFLLIRIGGHYLVTRRWCSGATVCDDLASVTLLKKCGDQLKLKHLPELKFSQQVDSPVITGLLKPVLLLPNSAKVWSSDTLQMVMLHELGHVQRRDLWLSLAGQIACALHWFNPLVWMLRKRLVNECEYACDAHVISSGAHPKSYINALCDVAEACCDSKTKKSGSVLGFSAALAMANQASLKNRVTNLLGTNSGMNGVNTIIVFIVLGISASAALAINLVRPSGGINQESVQIEKEVSPVDEKEVNLRLNANPFPGDE